MVYCIVVGSQNAEMLVIFFSVEEKGKGKKKHIKIPTLDGFCFLRTSHRPQMN